MNEQPLTDEQLEAMSFEEAQARLEQAVEALESGQLPLERAIGLYQQGLRLRDHCRARLTAAEAVIERLQESGAIDDASARDEETLR